jgi:capsular polysaccharide biosynthesis protein/Mrp family chromosome partitioning ATPase
MSTWRIGFLSIAARWWAVVVLATAAGGLLAYLYGASESPTYEAEAKLHVDAPGTELGALQTAPELAPTYAELVSSTPVLQRTVRGLNGRLTLEELRENVRGEWDGDTRLLTVRARSGDPAVAVLAANGLARQLVREASTQSPAPGAEEATLKTELRVVEPAADADRVRPQNLILMGFGALAGFFLALALAVLVDSRRRIVRDEEDLTELAAGTVLGSVDGGPLSRRGGRAHVQGFIGESADAYQRLAERVHLPGREEVPRSLLVFGAQRGAGSGTVAANLAAALADTGVNVVLADLGEKVEAVRLLARDGRGTDRPTVERDGALRHGRIVLDRFALRSGHAPLLVLPRGGPPRSLDVAAARGLVELLLAEADVVVLHSGPPSRSPRSLTLARAADVTILVVRQGHTKRDTVASTLDSLGLAHAKLVRTVLHTSRRWA